MAQIIIKNLSKDFGDFTAVKSSSFTIENGEFFIEDLGSANGVWKDGIRIQKELIHDSDEFMISEEVLRFVFR